jgi:hypothetical protein
MLEALRLLAISAAPKPALLLRRLFLIIQKDMALQGSARTATRRLFTGVLG